MLRVYLAKVKWFLRIHWREGLNVETIRPRMVPLGAKNVRELPLRKRFT